MKDYGDRSSVWRQKRWTKLMRRGLAALRKGKLKQYTLFGVVGFSKRLTIMLANSRIKQAWRERQKLIGKWYK